MRALHNTVRIIDQFTDTCGKLLAWLCLLMVVVSCLVVFLRYGFGFGSIAAQESVTYMHAVVFMLGAGYTLKQGGHVRVDIFYRDMQPRSRAWVNCIGGILFLLPFCIFVVMVSASFVTESWAMREGSPDPGGIHGVFLLKTLIPLMAFNLILQGSAEVLRNLAFLIEDGD